MTGRQPTIGRVVGTVSKFYDVLPKYISGKSRKAELVRARHATVYLLRKDFDLSFPSIGRRLGRRDHTSIIYAYRKVENALRTDRRLAQEIESIRFYLGSPKGTELLEEKTESRKQEKESKSRKDVSEGSRAGGTRWDRVLESVKEAGKIPSFPERTRIMLKEWRSGKTLAEIAKQWNLSRERVRQVVGRGLAYEIARKVEEGLEIEVEEFLKQEKLMHGRLRDEGVLAKEKSKKREEKPSRWSRFYSRCRSCGTTMVPHLRQGYCERCFGGFKGERREEVIAASDYKCGNCGLDRDTERRKFGRDLYITKERVGGKFQVLCRTCFLERGGRNMVESRMRRSGRKRSVS